MRSNAWLAARVSLRLARLPRTASSAQRSRRLRSTSAAAPVLLVHAEFTKKHNIFQWVQNLGTPVFGVDGRRHTGHKRPPSDGPTARL